MKTKSLLWLVSSIAIASPINSFANDLKGFKLVCSGLLGSEPNIQDVSGLIIEFYGNNEAHVDYVNGGGKMGYSASESKIYLTQPNDCDGINSECEYYGQIDRGTGDAWVLHQNHGVNSRWTFQATCRPFKQLF